MISKCSKNSISEMFFKLWKKFTTSSKSFFLKLLPKNTPRIFQANNGNALETILVHKMFSGETVQRAFTPHQRSKVVKGQVCCLAQGRCDHSLWSRRRISSFLAGCQIISRPGPLRTNRAIILTAERCRLESVYSLKESSQECTLTHGKRQECVLTYGEKAGVWEKNSHLKRTHRSLHFENDRWIHTLRGGKEISLSGKVGRTQEKAMDLHRFFLLRL